MYYLDSSAIVKIYIFQNDFEKFYVGFSVTKTVVAADMQLIQKYPLRGYDSIQLSKVFVTPPFSPHYTAA